MKKKKYDFMFQTSVLEDFLLKLLHFKLFIFFSKAVSSENFNYEIICQWNSDSGKFVVGLWHLIMF